MGDSDEVQQQPEVKAFVEALNESCCFDSVSRAAECNVSMAESLCATQLSASALVEGSPMSASFKRAWKRGDGWLNFTYPQPPFPSDSKIISVRIIQIKPTVGLPDSPPMGRVSWRTGGE